MALSTICLNLLPDWDGTVCIKIDQAKQEGWGAAFLSPEGEKFRKEVVKALEKLKAEAEK